MKYRDSLIPLLLTLIVVLGIAGISNAIEAKDAKNLQIAAGELKVWQDWSINPCKYEYKHNGMTDIKTTVNNLSSQPAQFSMGDGKIVTVPAYGSLDYTYRILLKGQTERITITRLTIGTGIRLQESLILKIEPVK